MHFMVTKIFGNIKQMNAQEVPDILYLQTIFGTMNDGFRILVIHKKDFYELAMFPHSRKRHIALYVFYNSINNPNVFNRIQSFVMFFLLILHLVVAKFICSTFFITFYKYRDLYMQSDIVILQIVKSTFDI